MKENPGSHFKLMSMAGQMMLIQVFPLERYYPIATFPRLISPHTAYTATSLLYITYSKSKPPGRMVLQTGKARLWVEQRGSGSLVVCHNLQCLTRSLANLKMDC